MDKIKLFHSGTGVIWLDGFFAVVVKRKMGKVFLRTLYFI